VAPEQSNWTPLDLAAPEYDRPTEPPDLCGLIYSGKRHALSGPPEATKTLTALIFGLEHLRAAEDRRFALIDFEMGERATRLLLNDLCATLEEIARVYYVAPDGPPTSADLVVLSEAGVTLAVIDSAAGAYAVSGLDDNKRGDAETFSRGWITPMWQFGITTIVLDHVVKNAEARGRYAIGSERKLGTVDVQFGFEAVRALSRGGHGLVKIAVHKDRPGHLTRPHAAELELRSDPDTHKITWTFKPAGGDSQAGNGDSTAWRPTVLMDRVLEYISQHPEPIARTTLAKSVTGNYQYLLVAIDELVQDGRLRLDGKRIVPVPRNVPGTLSDEERSTVPLSTEGTLSKNTFSNGSADEFEVERLALEAQEMGL
jgi:hypothetical protein